MNHSRHNRREFINVTGAGLAGLRRRAVARRATAQAQAAQAAQAAADPRDPDLVVVNAKVYTMDTRAPNAEAFAVKGDRFAAVGTSGDVRNLAGKNTTVFDAKGMTVVPGFIDCHNHAGGEVLQNEVLVGNPFEVEFVSILSIVGKLKAKADAAAAGHLGRGLLLRRHQGQGQADAAPPRPRRGVAQPPGDRPPPRRPHLLLQLARPSRWPASTKDTPDPMGGTYDKDANGELNGRVTDLASRPFAKVGHAADLHRRAARAARPRRHRLHLQAVRPLRADQRAPPGRQPAGDAGRPRPRRAAAPHQLRDQRPGARGDDRRRHPDRLRRRVDQVRLHLRAHRGRLVLGAHDGAVARRIPA